SYPAKRMGVKTAMPIWEAKQHCRDLIVVPASYGKYQKYSSYVREIFRDYTDQVESFGLDEAWLDITGSLGLFGDPVKIAKEISDRIKRELGITVSIGVSFNKITAKLGSDYKKPDAITVIEPDTYKQIVYPLPVGDLLYVGNATQRKLGSYGIRTIGQLAETNPETLKGWFGVMGYTLSAFARGLDQTPVAKQNAHTAIKSVGNSATTPRDLATDEDVWLMLVLLSESVAMRMRDLGSKCNVVEIYVRDNELSGFTRRRKLDNPTNVSIEIARIRKIHPHMFRHTFVSILLSTPDIGVATVAAEAGHAQPSTTLAIYTQVYHKRQDSIRSQMSETLYKRKTPER
ncbi:Y-family DNA polymerase, partial [Gemmiger sp.]